MSDGGRGLQGFAPCGRRLRRPWTPRPPSDGNALKPASSRLPATDKPPLHDGGLTKGHSISCQSDVFKRDAALLACPALADDQAAIERFPVEGRIRVATGSR